MHNMCMCMQNAARSRNGCLWVCVHSCAHACVRVCVRVCTALRNTRYGPHVSIFLGSSCSDRSSPGLGSRSRPCPR